MSESRSLHNRVILLTGASEGIGAATANVLGREGARLIAHHRDNADLDAAQQILANVDADRKCFVKGNFEDAAVADQLWAEALDAWGHIDVLVLNAAMMAPGGDGDESDKEWHANWNRHYLVNVVAPARLMHKAVQHFRSRGQGVIIVMSSWVAQRGVTNPRMLPYAASKSAVKAVAQSVARAYAGEQVYSYIIAPGTIAYGFSGRQAADSFLSPGGHL